MVLWFHAKEHGVRGEAGFVMLSPLGWGVGAWIISVSEWGQIFPSGGSLVLDRVRVKLPTAPESHGSSVRRVPY